MFQLEDVKQLLEQTDEPTLTMYLNVDARSTENVNSNPGWKIWAKNALRDLRSEMDEEQKAQWAAISARAEQFFGGYQVTSKSLALLVGPSFERSFEFPFPIENQVSFGKPNVMPLLGALDELVRDVPSRRLQCDEIWSFCYAKVKNVTEEILEKNPDAGDVWTWTAIDADTKLPVHQEADGEALGQRARTAIDYTFDEGIEVEPPM